MLSIDTKRVGNQCREFRQSIGKLQSDVAFDTGYSAMNVSAFENGRNCNYRILLWYINHGIDSLTLTGTDNG